MVFPFCSVDCLLDGLLAIEGKNQRGGFARIGY
jgi:hypothetical protein